MTGISPEQALAALAQADLLYSPEQIESALDRMAAAITAELERRDPLLLVVMNGAFVPAARLLARLRFPLRVGYLHATRYRGGTRGGAIEWLARPRPEVAGQVVLVVDDIFDEGDTLKAILAEIRRREAKAVYSAVLVDKRHDRKVAGLTVDFVGLEVPDRYVFGCGMDYHDYWRNLPAIYAVGG
ncbi:MAG TPA: hypoxanthine-guanine phosphoribosyltransferase [Candidatus Competibacter sp.]|nr:hypoxanthine-guanine phosphoribosyltransferase [Candidatus Competibacteraceae bacterium]HRC72346.1 hypoxanthine-guanine phosphoribosyltransferase [Candidatus Competibacter sp.]